MKRIIPTITVFVLIAIVILIMIDIANKAEKEEFESRKNLLGVIDERIHLILNEAKEK